MSYLKCTFVGLCLLLASCQIETSVDAIILSNCHIINVGTGSIKEHSDIWIKEDRIFRITPHDQNLKSKNGYIDASDKFVIPGLWDMHAHIVDYDWVPNMYTALGVTGLRIMHGGPERMEDINKNRIDGFYKGFEFLYSSPITDGPGETWPGARVAKNPEEGRQLVREYHKKGYDFVKVYNFLDLKTFNAIAAECNRLGLPFAGHVPLHVTTEEAIQAGQKSIEHSLGLEHALPDPKMFQSGFMDMDYNAYVKAFLKAYDSTLKDNVLQITKTKNTWFCPTLVNLKSFILTKEQDSLNKNDSRLKYIPKKEQDYWFGDVTEEGTPSYLAANESWAEAEIASFNLNLSYVKPMLDNGSKFLAGTDTSNPHIYPGFSLHDELQLFVEGGFTELEALQTATLNPAIFIGRETDLGTIEEGKLANILVLDKNPLENIENTLAIYGLVRRGQYLNKEELNQLMDYSKH
ncbi:amidohydrolase family protein [Flagellimonas sp.]|uniref:amidohydrolase family protein n=1 Tax=Flagellimonas sp. TaxID=2058762 RepID=UPI003B52A432